MPFPHKNIRLPAEHYRGENWYFVTLCCANRRRVFADSRMAIWLIEQLRQHSRSHSFAVHAYCVMPDHLHALVLGLDISSDLLAFVASLKQKTAYEFHGRFHRVLWQKKFYDHILRPKESPERVAAYIWMNPVRKGICKDVRDYPYSGSFTFNWRKTPRPVQPWVPPWKEKTPA